MSIAFMLAASLSVATPAPAEPILLGVSPAVVPSGTKERVKLDVPLPSGVELRCVLQPYSVATPETRFVIGRRGGADVPYEFDPGAVRLLRGTVEDDPDSHVVIGIHGPHLRGRIHRGDGTVYHLADTTTPVDRGGRPPRLPMCGVDHTHCATAALRGAGDSGPDTAIYRLRIAVETDWEYRQLFDSTEQAAAYIVLCYGLIGDIYLRDVGARLELTYVRLWETEDDLFNIEDPLSEFRQYWNDNMEDVPRNLAQFFSGRRDMPYGGVAWLSAVCERYGYSVMGYALGFTGDITRPDVFNYDVHVAAHEIGHNCGAWHTHNYGLDQCDDLAAAPIRGPIMSYCSQTNSGGNAMTDVRFHVVIRQAMRDHFTAAHAAHPTCFFRDCNDNAVSDADDILSGVSADANGNLVPDECEDCNGNGVLDPGEVGGTLLDRNGNLIPDECEPDCNGNGIPDDRDIELGLSVDLWGDGVPDECETDCDGDGQSDYSQLQAEAVLDLDRDAQLDACQDCDGDGTPDLAALDGAWFAWLGSDAVPHQGVRHEEPVALAQVHSIVGTRTGGTHGGNVPTTWEVLITSDRRILATSPTDDRVVEFDDRGEWVRDLVPSTAGLDTPTGLAMTPQGTLLVSSTGASRVLEFDADTGAPLGVFASGDAWQFIPLNIHVTQDGRALVVSAVGMVEAYDAATGTHLGTLVRKSDNGGMASPRGIAELPGGDIVVASMATRQVLRFDGLDGTFKGVFNRGGTETALTMDEPWGLRLGPDRQLYVSRHGAYEEGEGDGHDHGDGDHDEGDGVDGDMQDGDGTGELHINSTRIYVFDGRSGNFIRSYVTGHDTAIWQPTGFDFMPGDADDCNRNGRPDVCDLLSGAADDVDGDGVPDGCQCPSDLTGDGSVGVDDLLLVLLEWGYCPWCDTELTGDGRVDIDELLQLIGDWGACR
ncbi:MAG: M12 family metallo-peptidase [Planctomycetota bacterium]|nr:M12 family metallo-peptidase [Planctomycetota bacterium]